MGAERGMAGAASLSLVTAPFDFECFSGLCKKHSAKEATTRVLSRLDHHLHLLLQVRQEVKTKIVHKSVQRLLQLPKWPAVNTFFWRQKHILVKSIRF